MRLIDHLAVERQGAGIRVAGECRDDPLRPFPFRGADRKGFVDDGELRRMDRHLRGETRAPRREAFRLEPLRVLEIGVDRVDRRDFGGGSRQQAERARELVGAVIRAIDCLVVAAEAGRKILGAPGDRFEPR